MKSIIFLDIDGVINTQYGLDDSLKTRGETHDVDGRAFFCKDATDHVTKLIQHYFADIVLISNWRTSFKNVEVANKFFKERGLNWPIIGFTPVLKNQNRGAEIVKWMNVNGVPDNYIIINSDSDLTGCNLNQLIDIKGLSGFADRKLYRKAMNILKKPAVILEAISKEEKELF